MKTSPTVLQLAALQLANGMNQRHNDEDITYGIATASSAPGRRRSARHNDEDITYGIATHPAVALQDGIQTLSQ